MTKPIVELRTQIQGLCKEFKAPEFFNAYKQQWDLPEYETMSFDNRLYMLLDAEMRSRKHKRQQRNIKNARFPQEHMALFDNIDWDPKRNLDRSLLERLFECSWLEAEAKPWVTITGTSGVGKSFIATLLGREACMRGYTVTYCCLTTLIDEIISANDNHRMVAFRRALLSRSLLIIDEIGMVNIPDYVVGEILTILDQRLKNKSTILVGQIPLDSWHKYFGEPVKADALMDRIVNQSYQLHITGISMRTKYGAAASIES